MRIQVGPVAVDLKDDGDRIVGHLTAGKTFEPNSLAAWAKIVKPGTEVLDIGCYSGLFSIAAALLGARVVAVEPMLPMIERSRENFARNGVEVMLIEAAASDKDGSGEIHYTSVDFTAGASMARKSGLTQPVKLIRLDSLKVENVSAIKIDVERHEAAVLRGAQALLARWRPMLIVEALDDKLKAAVLEAIPGYRIVETMDTRNLLMEPI